MTSPGFDVDMGIEEYFTKFLNYFHDLSRANIVVDGYTIEYLLLEAYETIFGISDLNDKKEPLALVRYTNADTLGDIGSVYELIQTYRNNQILDKYGLSIKEYMDIPVDIAKLLISNVATEKEDLKEIVSSSERAADKEMKKNKGK